MAELLLREEPDGRRDRVATIVGSALMAEGPEVHDDPTMLRHDEGRQQ